MSDVERGYASLATAEPSNDWAPKETHIERLSSHSSTAYSAGPHEDELPRHHSTLYEQYAARRQVFWDRLQGKGRRVPGWGESFKNIALSSWLNAKFFIFPLAWTSHYLGWSDGITYYLCFVALIPLVKMAEWTGEQMSLYLGKDLGDLVIITLNNCVEASLAIVLLTQCELRLLHATIIGVVILHLLLIPGVAFLAGGAQIWEQNLHPHHTQLNHSLLAVGVLAVLLPTAFFASLDRGIMSIDPNGIQQYSGTIVSDTTRDQLLRMSRGLSVILLVVYVGSRIFLHNPPGEGNAVKVAPNAPLELKQEEHHLTVVEPKTNPWACLIVLFFTVGIISVTTQFLVEANEYIREQSSITEEWFGLIFLPLLSFSADALLAMVYFLRKLVYHVKGWRELEPSQLAKARTIDLSIQFTLFWMPFLVLLGWWMDRPMHLLFDYYELAIVLGACFLVNYVTADAKTNWVEGLVLLAFYVMIATSTWFYHGQPELEAMANCPASVADALAHGISKHHGTAN